MTSTVLGAVGTFALSLILAWGFLRLRCRRVGPPFGPRARYSALFIVVATALVSAGAGLVVVAASHHDHAAYVGIIVPAGLWFGKLPPQRDRDLLPGTLPGLLTLPLSRLYDRMGEDMQDWCDVRLRAAAPKPRWIADAAVYYHNQVAARLKDAKPLADLECWRNSIMHKITVVRMINVDTAPARLQAAMQLHPATQHIRGYTDEDLAPLARRLEAEALNELHLYLAYAYRLGYHKMLIYPFRPSAQRAPVQRAEPTV
ncbi:hypothetical protein [Trebonia sp.]|uniref:hypothetical protein n=1 Tax=Trebonia sp. TaxID=2767075 RepID=UPI002630DD76|nr:hypothetical protein [Trebonia sp.]